MSLSAQPAENPILEPQPAAGAPAPVAPEPRGRRKWLMLLIIPILAGIAWFASSRAQTTQKQQTGPVYKTAPVTAGPLRQTMRLAGSTSARDFANIVAPMLRGPDAGRALVIIYLAKSGSYVKKGDKIVEIDGQNLRDHVDDVNAQVVAAEADIRKRQAEHAISMENLRQQLRVAKSAYDKSILDNKTAEVRTAIDVELLKLAVEEDDANYKQLQKNVAVTEELHKAELSILAYTRDRHIRHRDRHKGDVELFNMKAPINGLVVMNQIWRGGEMGQVQEGDQVSPGQPFMKIVDPSSMQLDAVVNQVDSELLRIGQTAVVHFDAFPGLELKGSVISIGAMGSRGFRENYYVRSIPVRVAIHGSDPRVIPDLSASADVVLSEERDAVLVPVDAIQNEGGKAFVYVKTPQGFKPRDVQLGKRNQIQAAVQSGLQPGEEVRLGSLR
jgi:HlyD family secretion protein